MKTTVPVRKIKYDPIVDSNEGKFSAISLKSYTLSRGIIFRGCNQHNLIGFCRESPIEVLEDIFPDYYVTSFNGYEFFSSQNIDSSLPMLGLGISSINPPTEYGIEYNGNLEGFLKEEVLEKVRRKEPVSSEEVRLILENISKDYSLGLDKRSKQMQFDRQQIVDVVKKFG